MSTYHGLVAQVWTHNPSLERRKVIILPPGGAGLQLLPDLLTLKACRSAHFTVSPKFQRPT